MEETCFVIMPIGDQEFLGEKYKSNELKEKYNNLIKQSLLMARGDLKIIRSDEISLPGSITSDIFAKLMFSRYVIADISLPNPNVFYELGIRHAIRSGTILIKDKKITNSVFDVSQLRYIEYEDTSSGLKELSEKLKETFQWIDNNPDKIDNHFLESARFLKFQYPRFIDYEEERQKKQKKQIAMISSFMPLFENPDVVKIILNKNISEEERNEKLIKIFSDDPKLISGFLKTIITNGLLEV